MLKLLIVGETGALDAVDFVDRMKQRRDKLFAYYDDLDLQVVSAVIRCAWFLFWMAAIDLIAAASVYLFPKLDFLMSLLLALSAVPTAGLTIFTAVQTSSNLGGALREGVIMVDEFRHELHIFRDSDAGREMALKSPMGELEMLPNFICLTRFSNFGLWLCAGGSAIIFVIAFIPLLS